MIDATYLKFVAWADCRTGISIRQEVADDIFRAEPKFSILAGINAFPTTCIWFSGDLVENGANEDEWIQFFQDVEPHASFEPMMPCRGNHDTGTYFWDWFALPPDHGELYYSLNVSGLACVYVLDWVTGFINASDPQVFSFILCYSFFSSACVVGK